MMHLYITQYTYSTTLSANVAEFWNTLLKVSEIILICDCIVLFNFLHCLVLVRPMLLFGWMNILYPNKQLT